MFPIHAMEPNEGLASFVHALRQPLSTVGTSVYYLQRIISPEMQEIREQLARMEQDIGNAGRILAELARYLEQSRCQAVEREETAASLSSTNEQIAGVTY